MKKSILFFLLIITGLFGHAQQVQFTTAPNWAAVLKIAKEENKFIFIDGYATWCAPCKLMDKDVFPNKAVAGFMNDRFISLKIQTDRTPEDSPFVKSWYEEAKMLSAKFNLTTLPSSVVLSSEGELLYKGEGYNGPEGFLKMIKFAIDPETVNFRERLKAYQTGEKDYPKLPELIDLVKKVLNDRELVHRMTRDYSNNYLSKQTDTALVVNKNTIELAVSDYNDLTPQDQIIKYFRTMDLKKADPSGIAKKLLDQAIVNKELEWKLWRGGKNLNAQPKWSIYEKIIAKKYPELNARDIVNYYIEGAGGGSTNAFYLRTGNYPEWNKRMNIKFGEMLKDGKWDDYNNTCWFTYFLKITDKKSLENALARMNTLLDKGLPNKDWPIYMKAMWIDTKAALQYKLGYRQKAMATEQSAIALIQKENLAKGLEKDKGCKSYIETLELMKKGEKISPNDAIYPKDWKLLD